jgi:hypothetical protein
MVKSRAQLPLHHTLEIAARLDLKSTTDWGLAVCSGVERNSRTTHPDASRWADGSPRKSQRIVGPKAYFPIPNLNGRSEVFTRLETMPRDHVLFALACVL